MNNGMSYHTIYSFFKKCRWSLYIDVFFIYSAKRRQATVSGSAYKRLGNHHSTLIASRKFEETEETMSNSMQNQMSYVSIGMEILRNKQKDMLESKSTVNRKNNAFEGLMSRQSIAEEIISELEDIISRLKSTEKED
jgi:hypothetical protein